MKKPILSDIRLKMIHRFRRTSQRLAIKMTRVLNQQELRNEGGDDTAERDIIVLFRKMVVKPDSDLLISPLGQKYYIKNDSRQILFILGQYEVVVINHVFGYNIRISQKTFNQLYSAFVSEVEKRRSEMEMDFKCNVKHSLQSIIQKIDGEIQ